MTDAVNTANTEAVKAAETNTDSVPAAPATEATTSQPKYPAMEFVVKFSRLAGMVLAFAFLGFALFSILMGIFSEASFVWGMINAGFYVLIGGVLVGLVKGMGEAFSVLLELEKRK